MRQVTFAPSFAGWQQRRTAGPACEVGTGGNSVAGVGSGSSRCWILARRWRADEGKVSRVKVPKSFVELAAKVACHSELDAVGVALSRAVAHHTWPAGADGGHRRCRCAPVAANGRKAIRHDVHKMRAFVRFRAVEHAGETWYVAWFEPAHHVVELNAPFFVDRFASMNWSILTPDRCAHWDGNAASVLPRE